MRYLVFGICAAFVAAVPSGNIDSTIHTNVVVISDVHGDDLGFLKSLWIGLRSVNASEAIEFQDFRAEFDFFLENHVARLPPLYAAADTALMQMGDLVDRGKYGQRCIQILRAVEPVIGWTVRNLYGNHEVFAMMGWGYENFIHPEEDIDRAGGAFHHHGALWTDLASRSLLAVRVSNPTDVNSGSLFVHGGIELEWLTRYHRTNDVLPVDHLNYLVSHLVTDTNINEDFNWGILRDDSSPLMTRRIADSSDDAVCDELAEVLRLLGVSRMFVGHTPQIGRRVMSRCNGSFVLTDVAMSRWMFDRAHDERDLSGGQPGAVVLQHSANGSVQSIKAFYTKNIASQTIFEAPIEDQVVAADVTDMQSPVGGTTAIPGEFAPIPPDRHRKPEGSSVKETLVFADDLGQISQGRWRGVHGFYLEVNDVEQMNMIEIVKAQMLPNYILPDIEIVAPRATNPRLPLKRVFLYAGRSVLSLASFNRFGYLLADQIVEAVNYFHRFDRCVGLIPRDTDQESVTVHPEVWVRSFFRVDKTGDTVKLINMMRVHACANEDDRMEEYNFVQDALSVYLSEDNVSDPSDDDEDAFYQDQSAYIRRTDVGTFSCSFARDDVIEVVEAIAALPDRRGLPMIAPNPDIPGRVHLYTTDEEPLMDNNLNRELARQIIGVTTALHAHGLCIGFTDPRITEQDATDRVRLFFATDGQGTSVTLLNLAFATKCPDRETHHAELQFVREVLMPFTEEGDK